MDNFDDILPISARAIVVVEEGQVEIIVNGYKLSFTIHECSNKSVSVFLDDNTSKARKILKSFGVSFKKETKDEIYGDDFISYIMEVYSKSNTHGGNGCSWLIDNYNDLVYKEL